MKLRDGLAIMASSLSLLCFVRRGSLDDCLSVFFSAMGHHEPFGWWTRKKHKHLMKWIDRLTGSHSHNIQRTRFYSLFLS